MGFDDGNKKIKPKSLKTHLNRWSTDKEIALYLLPLSRSVFICSGKKKPTHVQRRSAHILPAAKTDSAAKEDSSVFIFY